MARDAMALLMILAWKHSAYISGAGEDERRMNFRKGPTESKGCVCLYSLITLKSLFRFFTY